jgi:hypothetical protein
VGTLKHGRPVSMGMGEVVFDDESKLRVLGEDDSPSSIASIANRHWRRRASYILWALMAENHKPREWCDLIKLQYKPLRR